MHYKSLLLYVSEGQTEGMRHDSPMTQISISALDADLSGADYGYRIAELRAGLRVLDERLDHLVRLSAAAQDQDLIVVEGPFAGETDVALETASRWMQNAREHLARSAEALGNAHIALSGLANRSA
jgi:hypothetical protein